MMRRWILGTAVAMLAVVPASGYGQSPSGDKMKDDATKMDKMEKKHDKKEKRDKTDKTDKK
jgi:hypothetical protein